MKALNRMENVCAWFLRHRFVSWSIGLATAALAIESMLLFFYLDSWLTLPY